MVRGKTRCNIATSKAHSRIHGKGKKQVSATIDVDTTTTGGYTTRSSNQCRRNLLDIVKLLDGKLS